MLDNLRALRASNHLHSLGRGGGLAVGLRLAHLSPEHSRGQHGFGAWVWHANETPYIWYRAVLGEGVNPPEPGRGKYLNILCVV